MNTETRAIDVENVYLSYKVHCQTSIKAMLGHRVKKSKTVNALCGISFSAEKGEIVGIVGTNGSGKSTLLRTIAGILDVDKGNIDIHNNTVSLLAIGNGFISELSGRDNIVLSSLLMGFSIQQIKEKMDAIISFSEIGEAIDYQVKTYSSGMTARLAFSLVIIMRTDIVLIDEALSVGDPKFKEKSFEEIKKLIKEKDRTVMIVSHNTNELEKLCNRIIWMEKGQIIKIGQPKEILVEYSKR